MTIDLIIFVVVCECFSGVVLLEGRGSGSLKRRERRGCVCRGAKCQRR